MGANTQELENLSIAFSDLPREVRGPAYLLWSSGDPTRFNNLHRVITVEEGYRKKCCPWGAVLIVLATDKIGGYPLEWGALPNRIAIPDMVCQTSNNTLYISDDAREQIGPFIDLVDNCNLSLQQVRRIMLPEDYREVTP